MKRVSSLPIMIVLPCAAACTSSTNVVRPLTAGELEQLAAVEEANPDKREDAAAHRASAAALREEERSSCIGVPDAERDAEPFAHRELVEAVTELTDEEILGKHRTAHLRGVQIVLRAMPGLTRPWLSRVIRCHMARHATTVLEHEKDDPLAVARPQVAVTETDTGFAISIRGRNAAEAGEIVRRAHRLGGDATP